MKYNGKEMHDAHLQARCQRRAHLGAEQLVGLPVFLDARLLCLVALLVEVLRA